MSPRTWARTIWQAFTNLSRALLANYLPAPLQGDHLVDEKRESLGKTVSLVFTLLPPTTR